MCGLVIDFILLLKETTTRPQFIGFPCVAKPSILNIYTVILLKSGCSFLFLKEDRPN